MSHAATNWAIKQRGLKPSAKIVLWHLCDRYHPDYGCFPSLETLAEDCEMSKRSVYDQVRILEEAGLVRVESGGKGPKGAFRSNRYILGFEDGFTAEQNLPPAEFAAGSSTHEPSANSAGDGRQNLPPNLVRNNSVKEPSACGARKKISDGENLKRSAISAWVRGKRNGITQDWLTRARIEAMKRDGELTEAEAKIATECAG